MARRQRLALEDIEERVDRGAATERRRSAEGFVEHGPQAVDVGAGVNLPHPAGGLLGRHRGGCAEDGAGHRGVAVVAAGEAEVGEVRGARGVEEDVRRFDVAVEDAAGVEVMDGSGDLDDEVNRLGHRQRPVAEAGGEVVAIDEIHGAPQLPVSVAGVVDRHDSRMADAGGQSRLGEKPAALFAARADATGEELHRHVAPETDMPGPVDDPHPAAAELGEQLIRPEDARQRGGWLGLTFAGDRGRQPIEAAKAGRPRPEGGMGRKELGLGGLVSLLERRQIAVEDLRGEIGLFGRCLRR